MKKILFALPMLALAALFTYCNKSDLPATLSNGAANQQVTDRACGDLCILSFTADNLNTLRVCGVSSNITTCQTCTGFGNGGMSITGTGTIPVLACGTFYVTNPNSSDTYLSFDGGATYTVIPANGGCVAFTTDGNCKVI